MMKIYNYWCYIVNIVIRIIIVNAQGGAPYPLHKEVGALRARNGPRI